MSYPDSNLTTPKFITLNADSFTIPKGSTGISITNDGAADIIVTNILSQTYALKTGEILEFKSNGVAYTEMIVDATASSGRIVYIY